MNPLPHLVLNGFMGVGKTTIGRLVAQAAGVPFVDLDDRCVAAARTLPEFADRPPTSTAEIFAAVGEPAFRRIEAAALAEALAAPSPTVIAAGGGALLPPETRAAALSRARVVTLTAPLSALLSRVAAPDAPTRLLLGPPEGREARARALLESRAHAYAEAHATVAADTTPEAAAAAVLRVWQAPSVLVPLGARSYPVRFTGPAGAGTVTADVLATLRPSSWFLVTDTTVYDLWGSSFLTSIAAPAAVVRLPPGEPHKTLAAVEQVLRALVEAGADRGSVIVAHGGGVVSDVAGFAAACLLRGVRWVAVPTTLLSMADAAIGGKTGVDIGPAKNAAGAFHQPSAVVIDPHHTATETDRAFVSGLAEIVKTAAIADASLASLLESRAAPEPPPQAPALRDDPTFLELALTRAASVKSTIVAADERESGVRAHLNFGHTLGHALEAAGAFQRWTHGEAVSLGMVAALRAGRALGITDDATATRLIALLAALGLPVDLRRADVEAALPFLALDKKRRGAAVRAVFVPAIGAAVTRDLPLPDLHRLYLAAASD